MAFENRGTDANKKVNAGPPGGRKRQLLVDTDGRIWFAHVHAANESDGSAALTFLLTFFAKMSACRRFTVTKRTMGYSLVK